MNRTTQYLVFLSLLFSHLIGLAQYDAPAVEWKINDCPTNFPNVPIGAPTGSYQAGQPQTNAISGEDWWYSINPAPDGGYYATGYATWQDFDWNEPLSGQPSSCKYHVSSAGLDLMAPRKATERVSGKLATVAKYDKDGNMLWCKPHVYAREGAVSSTVDAQGNIIVTGTTDATVDVQGNALRFNPQAGSPGTGPYSLALCNANEDKMFAAKISPAGNLLWMSLYSAYDLNSISGPSNMDVVKTEAGGIDVVIAANGNYVVVGRQVHVVNGDHGILAVELNPANGKIVNRSAYFADDHWLEARAVALNGTDFLICGYAEDKLDIVYPGGTPAPGSLTVGRGHGMIMKLNSNLANSTGGQFGNVVRPGNRVIGSITQSVSLDMVWITNNYTETTTDLAAGRTTTIFDVKALNSGRFAAALVRDCNGCRSSGANRGLGELRIYNSGGGVLNIEPLYQTGDGHLTAFDLKIGFEPSDPTEITLVTTVNEGDIAGDQVNEGIMTSSLNYITGGNPGAATFLDCYEKGEYTPVGGTDFDYDITRTSALVSHHALDGTLKWEKVIDVEDGPMEVYPGDWKEQECVYQIMKGSDGEFVYVGNTSHNKDDYYIAKLYGNCMLELPYFMEPVDPYTNNVITLPTGLTVWDQSLGTDINVRGEIRIPANGILKVTGGLNVHFADSKQMTFETKLVVEPGGQLWLHDGTLTATDCPGAMWSGVEVWGQLSQPQYAQHQGTVLMTGGGTIEHAVAGIRVWKHGDWNSTGGIVRGVNAIFRNNNLDVEFAPYTVNLGGAFQPNTSYFRNCNFTTNIDYRCSTIAPHVTLHRVEGVDFFGCDFSDQRTDPGIPKNQGILSIDASYKVLGQFTGTTATLHEYYDATDYDVGTFRNLSRGVEALNVNTENSVTVDHVSFTDCEYGVKLEQVNDAFITRNRFDLTSGGNWFSSQYHIYLNESSGFQIEGNELTSQYTDVPTVGVLISESGYNDNEVYKNKLSNLQYGCLGLGQNRNLEPIGSEELAGLEFLCNENTDNRFIDETFAGADPGHGCKLLQGNQQAPAGNVFSSTGSSVVYHLNSTVTEYMEYWYDANAAGQTPSPSYVAGNLQPIGLNVGYTCATTFDMVEPGPGKPVSSENESSMMNEITQFQTAHASKSAALETQLVNGDRTALHSEVALMTTRNNQQVRTLLLDESPYLSESLLRALALRPTRIFSQVWLEETLVANIETVKDADFMTFLADKDEPLPASMLQNIQAEFGNLTTRGQQQHGILLLARSINRKTNLLLKNLAQDDFGIVPADFIPLLEDRGDILFETQNADSYLARGQKTDCLTELGEIDRKILGLSDQNLVTELQDYRDFKAEMVAATNAHGVLQGLDPATLEIVRDNAENSQGLAQVQAQNLLCFFLGECTSAPDLGNLGSSSKTTLPTILEVESVDFQVYPNPGNGHFSIEMKAFESAEVRITDLNGRLVDRKKIDASVTKFDLSTQPSGIYFVQLLQDGILLKTKKIILF